MHLYVLKLNGEVAGGQWFGSLPEVEAALRSPSAQELLLSYEHLSGHASRSLLVRQATPDEAEGWINGRTEFLTGYYSSANVNPFLFFTLPSPDGDQSSGGGSQGAKPR